MKNKIICLFKGHDWTKWKYTKLGVKTRFCTRCPAVEWSATRMRSMWNED